MTVPADRRQWFTAGFVREVVVAVIMIGGTFWTLQSKVDVLRKDNDRLELQIEKQAKAFEESIDDLRGDLKSLQQAQGEVIRAQERMENLKTRIAALEQFQADQTLYNQRFLVSLSELKRGL